jgi:hypothetical protein
MILENIKIMENISQYTKQVEENVDEKAIYIHTKQ